MPFEPGPYAAPELLDKLQIGDRVSPGVCVLSGHDRKLKWDVHEGFGLVGATTVFKSTMPVEFTATITLADQDDFDEWFTFRVWLLKQTKSKKTRALDIFHPDLAANEIGACVVTSVGGIKRDVNGKGTVEIGLLEYKPPKIQKVKIDRSQKADPNADLNAKIASLTEEYKRIP